MSAWHGRHGRGASAERRKQKRAQAQARQRQHDQLVSESRLSVGDRRGRRQRELGRVI